MAIEASYESELLGKFKVKADGDDSALITEAVATIPRTISAILVIASVLYAATRIKELKA